MFLHRFSRRAAICLLALNEDRYLDEWLQYHLYLGFDHIFIYDNSDANVLKDLPARYAGFVSVIHFPGMRQQTNAYNHFIRSAKHSFRWTAFIDGDEFILLKKHASIKDLLAEHCRSGALALSWVAFGSSGHEFYEAQPVLQRFTRREKRVSDIFKAITHFRDARKYTHPHYPDLKRGLVHDTQNRPVIDKRHPQADGRVAVINHYQIKSRQEFQEKIARGMANGVRQNHIDQFAERDHNEVEDLAALDFFRRQVPFETWLSSHRPYRFRLRDVKSRQKS